MAASGKNTCKVVGRWCESPHLGGYVCNSGDSLEWRREVASMWTKYYASQGELFGVVSAVGGALRNRELGHVADVVAACLEDVRVDDVVFGDEGEIALGSFVSGGGLENEDVGQSLLSTKDADAEVCAEIGKKNESNVLRGKHYRKNKAKALKKKQMGSAARTSTVAESRQDPQRDRAFASCSAETRAELQQSRAEMLIAQNKADKVKAESCVRHYEMVRQSRVNETRFELSRQTSEEKLRAISKKRLGEGYVEGTVYSSDAAASLSSGSVSPNSSISMAELKRREEMYRAMEAKVAAMTLEKSKSDEERKRLEKKYSVYEAQEANRKQLAKERAAIQRSVGMDGYSRWD